MHISSTYIVHTYIHFSLFIVVQILEYTNQSALIRLLLFRGIYLRSRSKVKYEILKWKWKWTQTPMLECAIAPPEKVAVNKVLMQYGIFSAVYKGLLSLKTKLISSIGKIRHWERECIFYFWTWTRCHVVAAAVTSLQTKRCRIQICKLVS